MEENWVNRHFHLPVVQMHHGCTAVGQQYPTCYSFSKAFSSYMISEKPFARPLDTHVFRNFSRPTPRIFPRKRQIRRRIEREQAANTHYCSHCWPAGSQSTLDNNNTMTMVWSEKRLKVLGWSVWQRCRALMVWLAFRKVNLKCKKT